MTAGLLLHERTLVAQPSLVRALGLREAFVVQQLFWHLGVDHGVEHDGHTWFPVTYTVLAAEMGLSVDAVRRSIETLEGRGVVMSCQPEGRSSRRKWYRVVTDHAVFVQLADMPDQEPRSGVDASSGSGVDAASSTSKTTKRSASRPRVRFLEFDALVEAFGEPGTREEAKFYAKVARSLMQQGKSPSEISDRGKRARARHPDCTVNVLLTRWSNFAPPGARRAGGSFDDVAQRDLETRR